MNPTTTNPITMHDLTPDDWEKIKRFEAGYTPSPETVERMNRYNAQVLSTILGVVSGERVSDCCTAPIISETDNDDPDWGRCSRCKEMTQVVTLPCEVEP